MVSNPATTPVSSNSSPAGASLPASASGNSFTLHTVNRYDPKQVEYAVREFWDLNEIPKRLATVRAGKKKFYLLDGPPYVNAQPHVGHVKTTASKDIWTRFKSMQGYDCHLQAGFDTHGLPVEVLVQKELGIVTKPDILRMGIEAFNAKCREKVENNEKAWIAYYEQLGAWRAAFPPYFTNSKSYMDSAWWTLARMHERGFLVQGERSAHWCPRCETVLSGYEVSDSYKDVTDPSLYIKFRIKGKHNEYLLVWTTTPWTLPANVAIAVAPRETYARVRILRGAVTEYLILAQARIKPVLDELLHLEYEVVDTFLGATLDGVEYEPLMDVEAQTSLDPLKARRVYLSIPILKHKKYKKHKPGEEMAAGDATRKAALDAQNPVSIAPSPVSKLLGADIDFSKARGPGLPGPAAGSRVVDVRSSPAALLKENAAPPRLDDAPEEEYAEFVSMGDGSGLVHVAPGHGLTDFTFGKHYGLPAVSPMDEGGRFTRGVLPFVGVFVKQADEKIVQMLERDGRVLSYSKITHAYPACWRCKTPLLFRLTRQWYLKIDLIKEKLLGYNESARWMPPSGQHAFRNWLELSDDWCISRQRFWGIPLPIWKCSQCGAIDVVESSEELTRRAIGNVGVLDDLHRHVVDRIQIACRACQSPSTRVEDVFDVWFDAGIAPWASLGYPKQNKTLFESLFPVNLVSESQDQIRGWFFYLAFAAAATFDEPGFKECAMMGWVLDEKGQKMSKSLGNVVSAKDGIEKLGADAIRLYYCWEVPPWEVQKFSYTSAQEPQRALAILWNTVLFYQMYADPVIGPVPIDAAAIKAFERAGAWKPEDAWLLSKLQHTIHDVTAHIEKFEFHHAGRTLMRFAVDDVSRWYVKLSRDRCSTSNPSVPSRHASLNLLRHVILETLKMAAPITPHLTEYWYQVFRQEDSAHTSRYQASVHFDAYPVADKTLQNDEVEKRMDLVRSMTDAVNAARTEAKIKLRWPVREVIVTTGSLDAKRAVDQFRALLLESCNALSIRTETAEPATQGEYCAKPFGTTGKVFISTRLDDEIRGEALGRELSRAIQAERKVRGFKLGDPIKLWILPETLSFITWLQKNSQTLARGVGADAIQLVAESEQLKGEFAVEASVEEWKVKAKFS